MRILIYFQKYHMKNEMVLHWGPGGAGGAMWGPELWYYTVLWQEQTTWPHVNFISFLYLHFLIHLAVNVCVRPLEKFALFLWNSVRLTMSGTMVKIWLCVHVLYVLDFVQQTAVYANGFHYFLSSMSRLNVRTETALTLMILLLWQRRK